MRIKMFVAVAVLVASPAAFAQKPSVEKCRADAKALWTEVHRPNAVNASYFVWSSRADEMSQCQDIDQVIDGDLESLQRGIMYLSLENIAKGTMVGQLNSFVHRHGLQKQFADDDKSGLR